MITTNGPAIQYHMGPIGALNYGVVGLAEVAPPPAPVMALYIRDGIRADLVDRGIQALYLLGGILADLYDKGYQALILKGIVADRTEGDES